MSETVYAGQSTIQSSGFQSLSATSNVQIFAAPGQWIKPAFGTSVMIECWGAGGGGAASNTFSPTSNTSGGAGGGGSYASNTFPINFFPGPAYVFVGVGGTGGAVPAGGGSTGGNSNVSFASDSSGAFIQGYGGNGAPAVTAGPGPTNSVAGGAGGAGLLGPVTFQNPGGTSVNNGGANAGNNIYSGVTGGAGRNPTTAAIGTPGGNAIFGGGGGGGGATFSTFPAGGPGGTSVYGGTGGPGGPLNSVGTVGSARGGGGGGAGISTTVPGSFAGGQGGRGEVRIFVF